jgi:hypothetical protein
VTSQGEHREKRQQQQHHSLAPDHSDGLGRRSHCRRGHGAGRTAAQASPTNIPAAVFKQNCLSTSVPSTQRVEYKVFRVNSDLHQVCTICSGNYGLQSDANVVVGYFTQAIKPGSDRVSSVA